MTTKKDQPFPARLAILSAKHSTRSLKFDQMRWVDMDFIMCKMCGWDLWGILTHGTERSTGQIKTRESIRRAGFKSQLCCFLIVTWNSFPHFLVSLGLSFLGCKMRLLISTNYCENQRSEIWKCLLRGRADWFRIFTWETEKVWPLSQMQGRGARILAKLNFPASPREDWKPLSSRGPRALSYHSVFGTAELSLLGLVLPGRANSGLRIAQELCRGCSVAQQRKGERKSRNKKSLVSEKNKTGECVFVGWGRARPNPQSLAIHGGLPH